MKKLDKEKADKIFKAIYALDQALDGVDRSYETESEDAAMSGIDEETFQERQLAIIVERLSQNDMEFAFTELRDLRWTTGGARS